MGINSEINAAMKTSWAHQAYKDMDHFFKLLGVNSQHVCYDDILTRIRNVKGPRYNGTCTGMEFYQMVVNPVMSAFANASARVYVLSADDENRKSGKKLNTTAKRIDT